MQHINTRFVTSTFLWNFTFLVKTTKTGGAFPWMKSQEWMSKNVNHDCPEPPTSPSGVPAKPKLLTKTHMRHQAWGNCVKRHLFSWQSPSATHRSLGPSALTPGPPPPPVALGPSWPAKLQMCHTWCDSSGWWLPRAANTIYTETLKRGNVVMPSK